MRPETPAPDPGQTPTPRVTPTEAPETPTPVMTPAITPTPAIDEDDDGAPASIDCNDQDPAIYPGAEELCDGVDNDCDAGEPGGGVDEGITQTWYADEDGDGAVDQGSPFETCAPGAQCDPEPCPLDCSDDDPNVHPGATEVCDEADNDCDGEIDEGVDFNDYYPDGDGDGFGQTLEEGTDPVSSCAQPDNHVDTTGDCDDDEETIYPNAQEIPYDGIDQDCVDGDLVDVDMDGHSGAEGGTDCNDLDPTVYQGADEVPYDGIDQDCDYSDLADLDGDGYDGGENGEDCNDEDDGINPGSTDIPYDGLDQDCTGEDLVDVDGDGHQGGDTGDDCNDEDASIYPGAQEIPYDEIDQDCDGDDVQDIDGDGHLGIVGGTDCDDLDDTIYQGAEETPYDGIDQDCDGSDLNDLDGDTYAGGPDGDDCDDEDASTYPGADEVCDETDNDCDETIDEEVTTIYYLDNDQDGYGDPGQPLEACGAPNGYVEDGSDCNDAASDVWPDGDGICALGGDCATILEAESEAGREALDGVYDVDPDGPDSGTAPYEVYCDMTTDGGGWTLVAKVNGADTENLLYNIWGTTDVFGNFADFSLTSGSDVLYEAYARVFGNELLFYDATALCGNDHRLLQSGDVLGGTTLKDLLLETPLYDTPYAACTETACPLSAPNFNTAGFLNRSCYQPFNPTWGNIFVDDMFGINYSYQNGKYKQRFGVQTLDYDTGIGSVDPRDPGYNCGDLDIAGDTNNGWPGHIVTVWVR